VKKFPYEGPAFGQNGTIKKIQHWLIDYFDCEHVELSGSSPVVDPMGVTRRPLLSLLPLLLPGLLALLRGEAPRCCPVSRASGCIPEDEVDEQVSSLA
ncbi:hypothetical protein L9F63_023137, partial [Diploptera punctata]